MILKYGERLENALQKLFKFELDTDDKICYYLKSTLKYKVLLVWKKANEEG